MGHICCKKSRVLGEEKEGEVEGGGDAGVLKA